LVGLAEITDQAFGDARKFPKAQTELRLLRSFKDQISAVPDALPRPVAGPTTSAPSQPEQKGAARPNLDQGQVFHVLRDALKHERIDLFLQPIVKLPQRMPRYYECFSRIRAADGSVVTPDRYIDVARDHGLLRTIDNMLLFRCIQLVRKAQRHNHELGFLCNISMETLGDRQFFQHFIAFMEENRNLASRLVFEVAEEDVAAQWETFADDLEKLARLGFRFSMDHVKHLGFDVDLMAHRRFTFVKVAAATLLKRAGAGGKNLRVFRDELRRHKIELIVEKVETEQQLLELLDLDISLAQGFLFGQPRLSRKD
jgi:cyclic-di-GMP phosphodiesterase TipF (flagellum assembly factor)